VKIGKLCNDNFNGNFNIQGRLSNGHERSLSAVMSPLWNKLHRSSHNSNTFPPTTSNRTSISNAPQASTSTNAPSTNAERRDHDENTDANGRRHAVRENCRLM